MPESVQSCFELSIHFAVFFSRKLFLVAEFTAGSLYRQIRGNAKSQLDAFKHSDIPQLFSVKSFS